MDKMGAPPIEYTTDGRANAKGIRCLYLGDSAETTIYETRAGAYDFVTVGKFKLKKDIIVVDLKRINQISPFIEELDCLEYAINKEHLNKINNEMGRIMRRSDSALDYIPTQYITDFVKSITHNEVAEYAGIEYKSVMHENGYNLAIFNPELFECIDTKIYKPVKADTHKSVPERNDQRKLFNFSFSLSERLRKCAYETRRKEVEIVREALDEWLKKHDY